MRQEKKRSFQWLFANERAQVLQFMVIVFLTWLTGILCQLFSAGDELTSFLYVGILSAWMLSVWQRVPVTDARRMLLWAAGLVTTLFALRVVRYEMLWMFPGLQQGMRRLYFVIFSAAALDLFLAAVYTCTREPKILHRVNLLWIPWGVIAVCCTVNAGGWLITVTDGGVGRGPLYWVIVLWSASCIAGALILLAKNCPVTRYARRWWIAIVPSACAALLLWWYRVNGGPPSIRGVVLFSTQEVYALIFFGTIEAMIQTGILPTNIRYEEFFRGLEIPAMMVDREGNIVLRTAGSRDMELPVKPPASFYEEPYWLDSDHRIRASRMQNGAVIWAEDLTNVRRMNEELENIIEVTREENLLLEEENRIRVETIRLQTQNHLYDQIAEAILPQVDRLEAHLQKKNPDLDEQTRLRRMMILGVYIKRLSNLILLCQDKEMISSEEVAYAYEESFRFVRMAEISCELFRGAEEQVSGKSGILAYALLEEVLEQGIGTFTIIVAHLSCKDGKMNAAIQTDGLAGVPRDGWRKQELREAGLRLSVQEEDGILYVRLLSDQKGGGAE